MEEALVAWVNACTPDSRIDCFGDLADGVVLCRLATLFLEEAGSDKQSLALYLSVPPGQADQVLLGALLLQAVEGPQREQAINAIMGLEDAHKAEIALLIETQMQGLAVEAPPRKSLIVADTVAQLRRPSAVPPFQSPDRGVDGRRPSGFDSSPEVVKELEAHAQQLRTELIERESQCQLSKMGQQKASTELREIQERACYEEDAAHDSERQLLHFEAECHRLVDEVSNLEDETLQQRKSSAKDSAFSELQQHIDEEARACRIERSKQVDVEARLINAELGTKRTEQENWMRAAWTTKLHKVEDQLSEMESKMRNIRSLQFKSEQEVAGLEFQSEEAVHRSNKCEEELQDMQSRYRETEEEHQRAQQLLDICGEELKCLKSCDLDLIHQELSMRSVVAARLEQNCGDIHTRSCIREAEIPLLEEAIAKMDAEHAELSEKKEQMNPENDLVNKEKAKASKVRTELTDARANLRKEEDQVRLLRLDCDEASARRRAVQEQVNAALKEQKAVAASRRPRPAELLSFAALKTGQIDAARPTDASKAPAVVAPMVQKLREQLQLREKELVWRELQAGEAEALHGKEMKLMSGCIHELGIKYARLLSESENAAAAEQDLQDELEEEALEKQKLKTKGQSNH